MFGAVVGLFSREWPLLARDNIYAITRPSVYLSVCLSVTRVDQSKWLKLGLRNFQHTIPLVFAS